MPAPPSTAQKAANQKAMNAAKAVSGASRSVAGKTSGGYSGGAGAGGGAGATASVGLQQQRGGLLGTGGNGMNFSGYGNYSGPAAGLGGSGNGSLLGGSALMQEAARRATAQAMAKQYSQYQSPPSLAFQDEGMPGGWGQQAFNSGPVKQAAVNPMAPQAGGFSEAQFGAQKYSPGDIYSNPDRSAPALRSVVNGINLMGGSPETKVDSMLKNMGYDNPYGRAAAVGRFGHETGGFAPDVLSGERQGDDGTAYGLAQWRGDRQNAAKGYAGEMGLSPSDIAGQAAFAGTEMANQYKPSFNQLQNATSVADAMRGMNSYERPRGYVSGGDPTKVEGYQEAMKLANAFGTAGQQPPTQIAGIAPAATKPQAPQTMADTAKSMWQSYAPEGLQAAAAEAKKVLVDMPAEKIAQYGGFERAGQLAQMAVGISKFLPGGTGLQKTQQTARYGERRGAGGDVMNDKPNAPKPEETAAPATTTTPTTVNPTPQMWSYPQYTQSYWERNLPVGVGGPVWSPTPPSKGLFDTSTNKKKKQA